MDWSDSTLWLVIGLAGNAAFFSRFLVQWRASERAGRSYVPIAFWYLSIVGSVILLAYAIHRRDPVFTLAFLPNCVVYLRNLILIRRAGADGSPSVGGGLGFGPALGSEEVSHGIETGDQQREQRDRDPFQVAVEKAADRRPEYEDRRAYEEEAARAADR
jgi:lipid-A-disaccharide synthase-like uncharacterized protein